MADLDPGLRPALLGLVEPDMRGDPMSPLRWTTKSTRKLAGELTRHGHPVAADTVGGLLRAEGFSLQANAKTMEGKRHPDRDAQSRHIREQVCGYQDTKDPVVSVDAKKKELVDGFKNSGREWQPAGEPARVDTHDFPDRQLGKAIPYPGTYPHARRLLITADAGGSQRLPHQGMEVRARRPGRRNRLADHGVPPAARHVQVEQVGMAWRPPWRDEMLTAARRARSPSRYWSAESP